MRNLIDRFLTFWLVEQPSITDLFLSVPYVLAGLWVGWKLTSLWPRRAQQSDFRRRLEALLAWLVLSGLVGGGFEVAAHLLRVGIQFFGAIVVVGIRGEGFASPDWAYWSMFVPSLVTLFLLLILLRWLHRDGSMPALRELTWPGLDAFPVWILVLSLFALAQWPLSLLDYGLIWGVSSVGDREGWEQAVLVLGLKILIAALLWPLLRPHIMLRESAERSAASVGSRLLLWLTASGAVIDGIYRLWRVAPHLSVWAGWSAALSSKIRSPNLAAPLQSSGEHAMDLATSPESLLALAFSPVAMLALASIWLWSMEPRPGVLRRQGLLQRTLIAIAVAGLMAWPRYLDGF